MVMKKNIAVFLICSLLPFMSFAEPSDSIIQTQLQPKHSLSISGSYCSFAGHYCMTGPFRLIGDFLNEDGTIIGVHTYSIYYGCYSLNYLYQINWLSIGGTVAFETARSVMGSRDASSDNPIIFLSIMPTMCFTYLNKKNVSLYSALSLGYWLFGEFPYISFVAFNATLIGTTFGGKRLYGLAELNVGTKGLVEIGIGYRF